MVIPNASTHLNFALLVIILLFITIRFISYDKYLIFITGTLLGGLLPDIDHPKATLSKIVPFYVLHRLFKRWTKVFKHGGITHTIFVNGWIFAGWYFTGNTLVLGLAIGYASHLYIDHIDGNKLNMLWYPFGRRKK